MPTRYPCQQWATDPLPHLLTKQIMPVTNRNTGTTLIEFVLAATLALLITLTTMNGWLYLQHHSYQSLSVARLHQDINAIMHLMAQDIRRAGFWAASPADDQAAIMNPFQSDINDIRNGRYSMMEAENSCLVYSYDLDKDGNVSLSQNEYFGFRLRDQAIEMRVAGTPLECNAGMWQDMTQNNTLIDELAFIIHEKYIVLSTNSEATECPADEKCRIIRMIEITLGGYLKDQPEKTLHINEIILLRNDKTI